MWCKNIISWQNGGKVLVTCTNKKIIIKSHFPGGSDGKVSAYNAGDLGLIPGLGRSPGEGNSNPLQYSCLENPRSETEEPGRLQSMGSQRVKHDWATSQTKDNRIDIVKKWMEDVNSSHREMKVSKRWQEIQPHLWLGKWKLKRWDFVEEGMALRQIKVLSKYVEEKLPDTVFVVVQLISCVWLFVTPWTAARQASLSFTISQSLLKLVFHWVGDAIQPSHPLSPPSAPSLNLSQHQGLAVSWLFASGGLEC